MSVTYIVIVIVKPWCSKLSCLAGVVLQTPTLQQQILKNTCVKMEMEAEQLAGAYKNPNSEFC